MVVQDVSIMDTWAIFFCAFLMLPYTYIIVYFSANRFSSLYW